MGSACCKRAAEDVQRQTPKSSAKAESGRDIGLLRVDRGQEATTTTARKSVGSPERARVEPAAVAEKQRNAGSDAAQRADLSDVAISLAADEQTASGSKPEAPVSADAANSNPEDAAAAASPAAANASPVAVPTPSKARAPSCVADLGELVSLHALEGASSVGQLAGLCGLLREATRPGAPTEALERARRVPFVAEVLNGDLEAALAEVKEACFCALDAFAEPERHRPEAIAEACTVVRSGDPELCFRLLEVLLLLKDETVLERIPTQRIGALVAVLGRLPRGTLNSKHRSDLVTFCIEQVKKYGTKLTPADANALVALRLVPAVLAAFDSTSDGAEFAATDEDDGEHPQERGRLDYEGEVQELDVLLRKLEKCGWWRAEAVASVARQALAAALSNYDPLQDALVRVKAAGRIVAGLVRVGQKVWEGVSTFGVSTLIELAVFVKDALAGENVGAEARQLWSDLGRLIGSNGPQGKKCWYRPARLLTALAEGGHMEELRMVLNAMDQASTNGQTMPRLSAVAAQPKLAAALAAALVLAVEAAGGDNASALAAVDIAGALAEAAVAAANAPAPGAKKAAREAAVNSATVAARALLSIAASECGGAAAATAAEQLGRLARKEDRASCDSAEAAASLLRVSLADLAAGGFRPKQTLPRSPCARLVEPAVGAAGPSLLLGIALKRSLEGDPDEAKRRKDLYNYAGRELNKKDLREAVALYVPPKATTDLARTKIVDLHTHAADVLARALPGAVAGGPRALLIAGEPGSSKSTFLAFLHRRACEQWRRTHGRPPRGDARLPVTCLLRLPRLGRAKVATKLRAKAAKAMGVPKEELENIKSTRGLVLLLDAYDELDCRDGPPPRLWPENDLANWASAVVVTCRSSLLAVRDDYKELFAPSQAALDQLCTHPFDAQQVEEYFKQFAKLPAETRDCECNWTAEEYLSHIKRVPGTLSLIENPFTLNMVARTLPKIVSARKSAKDGPAGSLLTIRELYNAFVEHWFEREWNRVRDNPEGHAHGVVRSWRGKDFEKCGRNFCKDLASAMFEANVSEFRYSSPELDFANWTRRSPAAADQEASSDRNADAAAATAGGPLAACIDLMQNQESAKLALIREHCPLSISGSGAATESPDGSSEVHVRFLHKTLLEFFVAEEMYEEAIARQELEKSGNGVRRGRLPSMWSTEGKGLIRRFLLTNEPKILEFLADCCRGDQPYCDKLLGLMERSREPHATKEDLIASANAMTILNCAGFSFAGRCLRGVRVPGADLQRLEAAGADLRDADLTGCGLQEANLAGADLRGARLDGCAVVAEPALCGCEYKIRRVVPLLNGRRVLTEGSKFIANGGEKLEFAVWDVQSKTMIKRCCFGPVGEQYRHIPLDVSQDGSRVMWADDMLRVYDMNAKKLTNIDYRTLLGLTDEDLYDDYDDRAFVPHRFTLQSVKFAPDGHMHGSRALTTFGAVLALWDLEQGALLHRLQFDEPTSAVFSKDCQRFLALNIEQLRNPSDANAHVRVYDFSIENEKMQISMKLLGQHTLPDVNPNSVQLSGDGRCILTVHSEKADNRRSVFSTLWRVDPWSSVCLIASPDALWRSRLKDGQLSAISPDGVQAAIANTDRTISLLDLGTGVELYRFSGHRNGIRAVAFLPECNSIVSASEQELRIWPLTRKQLRPLERVSRGNAIRFLCLSPDREQLRLGSDKVARL
eukprot:tig00021178_g19200.t1